MEKCKILYIRPQNIKFNCVNKNCTYDKVNCLKYNCLYVYKWIY